MQSLAEDAETAVAADAAQVPSNRKSFQMSVAMRKWLWPTFRDGDKSGVSCGAVIISFVIMPGVRS